MTRYYVCLPQNLPDVRKPKLKSSRDKWNERVKKWTDQAALRNMAVQFHLWDESILFGILSEESCRGRHWFWFGTEALTQDWFANALERSLRDVGPRYSTHSHGMRGLGTGLDNLGCSCVEPTATRRSWSAPSVPPS